MIIRDVAGVRYNLTKNFLDEAAGDGDRRVYVKDIPEAIRTGYVPVYYRVAGKITGPNDLNNLGEKCLGCREFSLFTWNKILRAAGLKKPVRKTKVARKPKSKSRKAGK